MRRTSLPLTTKTIRRVSGRVNAGVAVRSYPGAQITEAEPDVLSMPDARESATPAEVADIRDGERKKLGGRFSVEKSVGIGLEGGGLVGVRRCPWQAGGESKAKSRCPVERGRRSLDG
jgi:hypothetical protein